MINQVSNSNAFSANFSKINSKSNEKFSDYFNVSNGEFLLRKGGLVSRALSDGANVTIFKSDEYSTQNPVLKMSITDKNGKVSERLINANDIDPKNASQNEMLALNAHLVEQGKIADIYTSSVLIGIDTSSVSLEQSDIKRDFIASTRELMDMQKRAKNIELYYKLEKILALYNTL